eukprot:scaffold7257_cov65-Phaeocystis_antarctica.AAC.10
MEFCRLSGTSKSLMTSWFHTDVIAVMVVATPIIMVACIGSTPLPLQLSYWTMAIAQHWMTTHTHCSWCRYCPVNLSSSAQRYGAIDLPKDMVPGSATSRT